MPHQMTRHLLQLLMGELLGVAGTDVPIAEIVKLVPAHMVRGYWRGWTTLYRDSKIQKNHFTTFSLVVGATKMSPHHF